MEVRLIFKVGKKKKAFRLREAESVIGRARGCTVRIPSSDVSRAHCRVLIDGTSVQIEDLGSLNGTLVNGDVILKVTSLKSGDLLEVGPARFTVEFDASEAAEDAFEVVDDGADAEEAADVELVEDAPEAEAAAETDDAPIPMTAFDIDEDMPTHTGGEGDMRDLLAQLDDLGDADAPPKPKKKPKKK